jgi:hypothetical protein
LIGRIFPSTYFVAHVKVTGSQIEVVTCAIALPAFLNGPVLVGKGNGKPPSVDTSTAYGCDVPSQTAVGVPYPLIAFWMTCPERLVLSPASQVIVPVRIACSLPGESCAGRIERQAGDGCLRGGAERCRALPGAGVEPEMRDSQVRRDTTRDVAQIPCLARRTTRRSMPTR